MSTYICPDCSDGRNKLKFRVKWTDSVDSAFAEQCPRCGTTEIEYL